MEWLKTIAPLMGVAIGWGLSEYGKLWADKRQDKKKLKRLLYYLLELRFQVSKDLNFEKEVSNYLKIAEQRLSKEFGNIIAYERENIILLLKRSIKKEAQDESMLEYLEKDIDQAILELADIYPIFAYELSGQYKIKDRLKNVDRYFNEIDDIVKQAPFDMQNWIQPKLTEDLISDMDFNLKRIAKKIDNKISKQVTDKIKKQDAVSYDIGLLKLLEEYIAKVKESI
jgi:hypothetical protein